MSLLHRSRLTQLARAVCKAVYDNQEMLGKMAAEESRMGDVNDKIAKCRNKSALILGELKRKEISRSYPQNRREENA